MYEPELCGYHESNLNKLPMVGFIESIKEVTYLSPIILCSKENGSLRMCVEFQNPNVAQRKIRSHYHLQTKFWTT